MAAPREVADRSGDAQRWQRLGSVLACEHAMRWVARTLAPRGIPVMPLKGVLLRKVLYRDPGTRLLADIDVLAPQGRYGDAQRLLSEAGCRFYQEGRSRQETTWITRTGVHVDLHRRLFPPTRFRMPTRELFARGTVDESLFGAPVVLPCEADIYAHLVGKLATDHVDRREAARVREIALLGERLALDAAEVTAHLLSCGLGRAARYTLTIVAAGEGDELAREVLRRLPSDPVGRVLAAGARAAVERTQPKSSAGAVAVHALGPSLATTGASLGLAALNRVRHRWQYGPFPESANDPPQ